MKNIRALIEVEARPAIMMGIYFLIVNIGGILLASLDINSRFERYLRYGKAVEDINGEIFLPLMASLVAFTFFGMIILIYFQFKHDKSIDIGRFLKALPYTNMQRCLVKVVAGILSFSVPFIVFSVGLIALRSHATLQFKEAYSVLPYERVIISINSLENLIYLLVLVQMVYIAVYLFVFMVQYLMNNNIGSLVVSILSLAAPAFITISAWEIYRFPYYARIKYERLFLPIYSIIVQRRPLVFESGTMNKNVLFWTYIEDIGVKMLIAAVIGLLCGIVIYQVAKKSKVEDADVLIPHLVSRWIFVIGVSVCAAFLVAVISKFLILPLIIDDTTLMTQVMLVIGGVVGFIVAKKIGYIGIVAKKRTKLKKIIPLVLCMVLCVGCTPVEEEASAYRTIFYDDEYYARGTVNWQGLQEKILRSKITDDGRWGFSQNDDQFFIDISDIESTAAMQVGDVLEEVIGEGFIQIIEDLKATKEGVVTKEATIGEHAILFINNNGAIRINLIKRTIQLKDELSQNIVEKVRGPEFMLTEMRVGEHYNMLKIETPQSIINRSSPGFEKRMASYYQLFRKNTGEVTKVRWVINTFDVFKGENLYHKELDREELETKHVRPLQNIVNAIATQETSIEPIILDLKSVYDNKKIKSSGKINDMNYKINKYGSQNDYEGELIEVILEINK